MTGARFLTGDRVTLRVVEDDDLPFAQRVVNHPDVRSGIGAFEPLTMADEREWFEALGDGEYHFVVWADTEPTQEATTGASAAGRRVGVSGVRVDEHNWGLGSLAYMIHPDHWGNGYATDAVRTLGRYAFDELRLAKLEAEVYGPNEGSQRVLEKAGFEREAVRPDHVFHEGERVDLYEYGRRNARYCD